MSTPLKIAIVCGVAIVFMTAAVAISSTIVSINESLAVKCASSAEMAIRPVCIAEAKRIEGSGR